MRGPRLPLGPLRKASGAREVTELARMLGVDRATLHRAARPGLTVRRADMWACRLGVHPACVWPDWWHITGVEALAEQAPAD